MDGHNVDLSEAIIVYLRRYPGKNTDEFEQKYGANIELVRGSVRAILDEAVQVTPDWSKLDLNGAGDFVESVISERHPELTARALTAIGNYYTYQMR
jgi:hypothetical protein